MTSLSLVICSNQSSTSALGLRSACESILLAFAKSIEMVSWRKCSGFRVYMTSLFPYQRAKRAFHCIKMKFGHRNDMLVEQ